MPYHSNRAQYRAQFAGEVGRRVKAAAIFLSAQVKADISQPGTLRYHPLSKKGVRSKSQKTVYNFTHSRPGNPPFKQSGNLRQSVGYEALGLVARVGSAIKKPRYPYFLEMGTRRMAARPYLRRALVNYRPQLVALITRPIRPGSLPAVVSNQFRSGHFGRGARAAGWD